MQVEISQGWTSKPSVTHHIQSDINTFRTGSFKLFKRPFPDFF